jgi:hypothetical protein
MAALWIVAGASAISLIVGLMRIGYAVTLPENRSEGAAITILQTIASAISFVVTLSVLWGLR